VRDATRRLQLKFFCRNGNGEQVNLPAPLAQNARRPNLSHRIPNSRLPHPSRAFRGRVGGLQSAGMHVKPVGYQNQRCLHFNLQSAIFNLKSSINLQSPEAPLHPSQSGEATPGACAGAVAVERLCSLSVGDGRDCRDRIAMDRAEGENKSVSCSWSEPASRKTRGQGGATP